MTPSPKRIMYLEDVPDIAEITVMTLEDLYGYEVLHCLSGEQLLRLLPQFKPDLLLLDVMVPGIDGPETLRRARAISHGQNVPAIFMTAKIQTHEVKHYQSFDALGVISKPFNPATLNDEILELWQTR